jgi:hypothetical protein
MLVFHGRAGRRSQAAMPRSSRRQMSQRNSSISLMISREILSPASAAEILTAILPHLLPQARHLPGQN